MMTKTLSARGMTLRMLFFACLLLAVLTTTVTQASNAEGLAFLEENGKKPDVVTLPSGLQYKVLQKGTGVHHPLPSTTCSCHYHGTLIDGTVFDSSYDRGAPTSFAPNQVIKGYVYIFGQFVVLLQCHMCTIVT